MSKNSTAVRPVDAELLYDLPSKRRKSSSRKKPEPEIDIAHEIERLFASRYHLVQEVEKELRKLSYDALSLLMPVIHEMLEKTRGQNQNVPVNDGIFNMITDPLSALEEQAQELRIAFERALGNYYSLAAWTANKKSERESS